MHDVIIVGGGASGFFTANILLENDPSLKVFRNSYNKVMILSAIFKLYVY